MGRRGDEPADLAGRPIPPARRDAVRTALFSPRGHSSHRADRRSGPLVLRARGRGSGGAARRAWSSDVLDPIANPAASPLDCRSWTLHTRTSPDARSAPLVPFDARRPSGEPTVGRAKASVTPAPTFAVGRGRPRRRSYSVSPRSAGGTHAASPPDMGRPVALGYGAVKPDIGAIHPARTPGSALGGRLLEAHLPGVADHRLVDHGRGRQPAVPGQPVQPSPPLRSASLGSVALRRFGPKRATL
jgi:hypothetical protein